MRPRRPYRQSRLTRRRVGDADGGRSHSAPSAWHRHGIGMPCRGRARSGSRLGTGRSTLRRVPRRGGRRPRSSGNLREPSSSPPVKPLRNRPSGQQGPRTPLPMGGPRGEHSLSHDHPGRRLRRTARTAAPFITKPAGDLRGTGVRWPVRSDMGENLVTAPRAPRARVIRERSTTLAGAQGQPSSSVRSARTLVTASGGDRLSLGVEVAGTEMSSSRFYAVRGQDAGRDEAVMSAPARCARDGHEVGQRCSRQRCPRVP